MLKDIIRRIQISDNEFRGMPFWAWNSKLDDQELQRQIGILHSMGMGGFFMHARVGLDTPYLSDEWFQKVALCIDTASALQMDAWLYDEDRWPSGTAGGAVTAEKRFRIQALIMSENPPPPEDETIELGVFAVDDDEKNPQHWHKLGGEKVSGKRLLYFFVRHSETETWYNGNTYLNTLEPEAVARFIQLTHEQYSARMGNDFGSRIKGIFTDEPNYRTAAFSENVSKKSKESVPMRLLPWTTRLPELFSQKYGYDLLSHLPELFYNLNGEEFSKTRLDYYNLLTELFVNSYPRQIGEWCRKHHLPLTGHAHWEDSLLLQRHQVGAAMRFYEYLDMPGIDMLTEHWAIYDTVKQCVSVAAQLGKKRRLTECYGCTGWDFPFSGHKAVGEWQYALGINFRCHHLAWYSMAGEAKRDYPASISFQSPWYRQYHVVEDHFARLGAALSEGREVREILVLHPIESTWGWKDDALITKEESDAEDCKLIDLRNRLLSLNLDFDYGDEELMSRYASIRAKRLFVGEASYSVVILPQLRTIRSSTLKLLNDFRDTGGLVAYLGNAPEYVDGIKNKVAETVFRLFKPVTLQSLNDEVGSFCRIVSIQQNGEEIDPVLPLIRQGEDFQTLFLCNVGHRLAIREIADRDTSAPACGIEGDQKIEPGVLERTEEFSQVDIAWRSVQRKGSVVELNPDTGEFYPVQSRLENGIRYFSTSLPQLGSRLFVETAEKISLTPRPAAPTRQNVSRLPESVWQFECDEPNVLLLDHPIVTMDEQRSDSEEYILSIDAAVRDHLGIPRRGGAMRQPYLITDRTPEKYFPVTLEYHFKIEVLPSGVLELAVEHPEYYEFTLNGSSFAIEDQGEWCDPVLRRLRIEPGLLRKGDNVLTLHTMYHEFHPGLEAIFLLGHFGVYNDVIAKMPETITAGDWCLQGFPYYAGNMTLRTTLQCAAAKTAKWLQFPKWRGTLLGVKINQSEQQILAWPPYCIEITPWLCEGENLIEITVYGHRRNAFGPFYLHETSPSWVGPAQFKMTEQRQRQFVPCGLLEMPVLSD